MRVVRPWGGVALWFCWALTAHAQSAPYNATVTVPEAEVRSGPSSDPKIYPTGKLRQGAVVSVVKDEEGGWLAITPPPGSFSWVNARLIEVRDRTGMVLGDDTPVRIGSELVNVTPTVEARAKLKRGTAVVLLDTKTVYAEDGGWYPIAPTLGEVRYIRQEAVQPAASVQTVQSSPAPAAPAALAPVGSGAPSAAADDPLWLQAQDAERAGRPGDAEQLYRQLAAKCNDHDLQMKCYNRITFLRQGNYRTLQSTYPIPSGGGRANPVPAFTAQRVPGSPAPGQVNSHYTYVPDMPRPPVGQAPPVVLATPAGTPPVAPVAQAQWSDTGELRRAGFMDAGRQVYVLLSNQGMPVLYMTAQPGVDLDGHLNHTVQLYGATVYSGIYKKNFMAVQAVRAVQ